MDDIPRSLESKARYEAILVTTSKDVACASERLYKLQKRVMNVTASCESTIHLQKASNLFVRTKNDKKRLKSEMKKKKEKILGLEEDLERLYLLETEIKSELQVALSNEETYMTSTLVHERSITFTR